MHVNLDIFGQKRINRDIFQWINDWIYGYIWINNYRIY
jgi:hypothetical protein